MIATDTSKHAIKVRLQEKAAKGMIYFFAVLTAVILLWIVGYILFRGFYYDIKPNYDVISQAENSLSLPGTDEEMIFIVNQEIKAEELTLSQIQVIFNKPRRENWGFYTRQDIKVHPFTLSGDTPFTRGVEISLLGEEEELSKYLEFASSPEEVIRLVSETEGGVGCIPASYIDQLEKVNLIQIRPYSVVVNPETLVVENNRVLQGLNTEEVDSIFSGEAVNWSEMGGRSLPIEPVLLLDPDRNRAYSEVIADRSLLEDAVLTTSEEEFLIELAAHPGGVGIIDYRLAMSEDLRIIQVQRRESGLNMTLDFLIKPPARSGKWGGISYIIINTLFLVLFTLLFSTPIGIAAAVYLVEYAKQGRMLRVLRMGTETLSAIPSIIFGLFGNIFFVRICGFGIGFISSTLTVTLMILPTIVRTSEEALKSVPQAYREGSLALGANKLHTIFKVVLPAASPGILTGVILAVGRTIGETAVLLYTLGSSYDLVRSATSSARVLSLHLYLMFSEAISFERAFATAAVLVFIVLIVNFITKTVVQRMNRMSVKS